MSIDPKIVLKPITLDINPNTLLKPIDNEGTLVRTAVTGLRNRTASVKRV